MVVVVAVVLLLVVVVVVGGGEGGGGVVVGGGAAAAVVVVVVVVIVVEVVAATAHSIVANSYPPPGYPWLPRTQSGRILVGFFWVFCIVIVATYTENLIAFLVVDSVVLPFTNLAELAAQSEYQWGVVKSYACEQIFRVDILGGQGGWGGVGGGGGVYKTAHNLVHL